MKCEACEREDHENCGMQTWCECDCVGPDAIGMPDPSDVDKREPFSTDEMIDALTDGEGDTVTFCCKNPDFNGLPNECITVNASWTSWQDRDFRADTRAECLSLAIAAMRG